MTLRLSAERYGRYVTDARARRTRALAPDEGCNRLFYRMLPAADEPYLSQPHVNGGFRARDGPTEVGDLSLYETKVRSAGPHSEIGWLSRGCHHFAPPRQ
ncbi:hypothetical protein GCM10010245_04550 [Streptomyces spectabilis]|nr:hypothetical protein GCM10010245_04550 [Streptomyces spectabilis]